MSGNGNGKKKMLKITGMRVKDFLIINDVELTPDSKFNMFAGRNKQGKTSFIKAITAGLKGTTDKTVIRSGADKSEIVLDLGDIRIQRVLKAKGNNTLKVTAPVELPSGDIKAMPIPSPQDYLDGLLSDFSFDPLAFIVLEGKERTKYLRELFRTEIKPELLAGVVDAETIGLLDFTKDGLQVLKDAENILYAKRTEINKAVAQKRALHDGYFADLAGFDVTNYKDDREEIADAIKAQETKLTEARTMKKQAEGTLSYVQKLEQNIAANEKSLADEEMEDISITALQADIASIQVQISDLQDLLAGKEKTLRRVQDKEDARNKIKKAIESDKATLSALPSIKDIPDVGVIESVLAGFYMRRDKAAVDRELYLKSVQAKETIEEYRRRKEDADALTEKIDKLRKDLPDALAKEANLPIPELRFDGDKVFIGEKSVDNMSTSEQVKVAVQIVDAFNREKPLKLCCVDRAESMDDETLAEFIRQIPDEYQFFTTFVQHVKGQKVPAGAYLVEEGMVTKA